MISLSDIRTTVASPKTVMARALTIHRITAHNTSAIVKPELLAAIQVGNGGITTTLPFKS